MFDTKISHDQIQMIEQSPKKLQLPNNFIQRFRSSFIFVLFSFLKICMVINTTLPRPHTHTHTHPPSLTQCVKSPHQCFVPVWDKKRWFFGHVTRKSKWCNCVYTRYSSALSSIAGCHCGKRTPEDTRLSRPDVALMPEHCSYYHVRLCTNEHALGGCKSCASKYNVFLRFFQEFLQWLHFD